MQNSEDRYSKRNSMALSVVEGGKYTTLGRKIITYVHIIYFYFEAVKNNCAIGYSDTDNIPIASTAEYCCNCLVLLLWLLFTSNRDQFLSPAFSSHTRQSKACVCIYIYICLKFQVSSRLPVNKERWLYFVFIIPQSLTLWDCTCRVCYLWLVPHYLAFCEGLSVFWNDWHFLTMPSLMFPCRIHLWATVWPCISINVCQYEETFLADQRIIENHLYLSNLHILLYFLQDA